MWLTVLQMASGSSPFPKPDVKKHPKDDRAYLNPFPAYAPSLPPTISHIASDGVRVEEGFLERIRTAVKERLAAVESSYDPCGDADTTVYLGGCGLAYLYLHLSSSLYRAEPLQQKEALAKAEEVLLWAYRKLERRVATFLLGDAGPLTLLALLSRAKGDSAGVLRYSKELCDLNRTVVARDPEPADEVLYGHAGYLYSLLLLRKLAPECEISDGILTQIGELIQKRGQRCSERERSKCPLLFEFYDTKYLGAAHGLGGIFYLLFFLRDRVPGLPPLLAQSAEFMLQQLSPDGNTARALGEQKQLVHWCHGAPGLVSLYCKAYEVTGERRFLSAAVDSAELVWKRGLLRKGHGLCHGVAGNAYAFLQLYKTIKSDPKPTKDDPAPARYLYYALKFAEWCLEADGSRGSPDTPYSMFEGAVGTLYFLADLLNLDAAAFPGYEL